MSNHPIVHVEIPASNPEEGARFYADLFGWKLQNDPNFDYWMFEAEGGPGGGFNKVGADFGGNGTGVKPGEVLVYVGTDDIEASLSKAESLGGKTLVPRSEIPGVGWFAVFADPTGNKVGLYTSANGQS